MTQLKFNRAATKRHTILSMLLMLLMLAWPLTLSANTKTEQLQRKTADIKLLHEQIKERHQQAVMLLGEIETQKDELIAEIRVIARSFKFSTYAEAKQNHRVYYNIELLRPLMAYTEAFESKIRFLQAGNDRLTYMRQLVQDDIQLTTTLNDYEIDALTTQISIVINKYMNDAHIIRIDAQPDALLTAEQVWASILGGNR